MRGHRLWFGQLRDLVLLSALLLSIALDELLQFPLSQVENSFEVIVINLCKYESIYHCDHKS